MTSTRRRKKDEVVMDETVVLEPIVVNGDTLQGALVVDDAEPLPTPVVQPTIRRIVNYYLNHGPSKGEARPAIIVRVWPSFDGEVPLVQLQVFTDSDVEGRYNDQIPSPYWATSVKYDPDGTPGTWNWG